MVTVIDDYFGKWDSCRSMSNFDEYLFVLFLQYWGVNPEPCACKASTLLAKLHLLALRSLFCFCVLFSVLLARWGLIWPGLKLTILFLCLLTN